MANFCQMIHQQQTKQNKTKQKQILLSNFMIGYAKGCQKEKSALLGKAVKEAPLAGNLPKGGFGHKLSGKSFRQWGCKGLKAGTWLGLRRVAGLLWPKRREAELPTVL